MDIPGFRLHPLKGRRRGHHAVSVSGNVRVTFRFEGENAVNVDYLNYHWEPLPWQRKPPSTPAPPFARTA